MFAGPTLIPNISLACQGVTEAALRALTIIVTGSVSPTLTKGGSGNDTLTLVAGIVLDVPGSTTTTGNGTITLGTSGNVTPSLSGHTLNFNGPTGGGGGSPGGSSPQIQFNNAGSFGGITGSAADGSGNVTFGAMATVQGDGIVDGSETIGLYSGSANGSGSITLLNPSDGSQVVLGCGNNSTGLQLAPAGINGPVTIGGNCSITGNLWINGVEARGLCEGRLTLTSGVAVTTSDVTGATHVFFTPYNGNRIALFDGTATWNTLAFGDSTLSLGTLTSGLPYDVFAFNNSGAVILDSPLAWTNGTTRATSLVLQDGVWVKSGATTRRYLGTFATTSATTTEDSAAKRYLWNLYNRERRPLFVTDTTGSWTYNSTTWRQANANTANQAAIVCGLAGCDQLDIVVQVATATSTTSESVLAIGEDSTTSPATDCVTGYATSSTVAYNNIQSLTASLHKQIPLGMHAYTWLEADQEGSGTNSWYGYDLSFVPNYQPGLTGWCEG